MESLLKTKPIKVKIEEDQPIFKVKKIKQESAVQILMQKLLESLRNNPKEWRFVLKQNEDGYSIEKGTIEKGIMKNRISIQVSNFYTLLFCEHERIRIGIFNSFRLRLAAIRWKRLQRKNLSKEENDIRARHAIVALGSNEEPDGFSLEHTEE